MPLLTHLLIRDSWNIVKLKTLNEFNFLVKNVKISVPKASAPLLWRRKKSSKRSKSDYGFYWKSR